MAGPGGVGGSLRRFSKLLLYAGLSLLTITIGTAAHIHVVRPRSRLVTILRLTSIERVHRLRTVTHGRLSSSRYTLLEIFRNIEFSISVPSYSIVNSFQPSSGGSISFRFHPRCPPVFLPVFLSACRRRHTFTVHNLPGSVLVSHPDRGKYFSCRIRLKCSVR